MAASKEYYDSHPGAKKKKNAYMKKYMQTDKAIAIRRAADRASKGKGSVGDGLDYSHRDGKLVPEGKHRSQDKKKKPNKAKLHIT
jgi:hypothetical protein